MLVGVNDSPEQAQVLAAALEPHSDFKVNLIPTTRPAPRRIHQIRSPPASVLQSSGLPTTVRLTRGRDIAAACGCACGDLGGRRLARRVVPGRRNPGFRPAADALGGVVGGPGALCPRLVLLDGRETVEQRLHDPPLSLDSDIPDEEAAYG